MFCFCCCKKSVCTEKSVCCRCCRCCRCLSGESLHDRRRCNCRRCKMTLRTYVCTVGCCCCSSSSLSEESTWHVATHCAGLTLKSVCVRERERSRCCCSSSSLSEESLHVTTLNNIYIYDRCCCRCLCTALVLERSRCCCSGSSLSEESLLYMYALMHVTTLNNRTCCCCRCCRCNVRTGTYMHAAQPALPRMTSEDLFSRDLFSLLRDNCRCCCCCCCCCCCMTSYDST